MAVLHFLAAVSRVYISHYFRIGSTMSDKSYCVVFLAVYHTIKTSFKHVFESKEQDWAKLTLQGLNKILSYYKCLGEHGVKPGMQTPDDIISMEDLNKVNFGEEDWKRLTDKCQFRDWNGTMYTAICETIETSFIHVYDNKNEEWATETLEGLKKVANYEMCFGRDPLTPGTQEGNINLTMDVLGYQHYDNKFWTAIRNMEVLEEYPQLYNSKNKKSERQRKEDVLNDGFIHTPFGTFHIPPTAAFDSDGICEAQGITLMNLDHV